MGALCAIPSRDLTIQRSHIQSSQEGRAESASTRRSPLRNSTASDGLHSMTSPPRAPHSAGSAEQANRTPSFLNRKFSSVGTVPSPRSQRHLRGQGSPCGLTTTPAQSKETNGIHPVASVEPGVQDKGPEVISSEMDGIHLSKRALRIIQRVDEVIRKCSSRTSEVPTPEEQAMYEVLTTLRNSPIGVLFVTHPEVSLSNRSAVITTPDFYQDEAIGMYRLRGAYNAGTIGRSYFATRERGGAMGEEGEDGERRGEALLHASAGAGTDYNGDSSLCILKVVNFVLCRHVLDSIVAEQRVLVNINYDNVLKLCDILHDEYSENIIVVTNYHSKGNISGYAGRLDHDPDKLLHILHEVGTGLRIIHSHKIYHHNLKLENVLETVSGHYCIADAGFSHLFMTQSPEALVFNGELACLPPEVFDPNGPYADDAAAEAETFARSQAFSTTNGDSLRGSYAGGNTRVAKVDIWGFGLLIYRLAYGKDPFEIAEHSLDEVREMVLHFKLQFPQKNWPFATEMEDAIAWCLEKNPHNRPTILKLLRHPFFRECVAQSHTNPRSTHSATFSGPGGSGRQSMMSASLGNLSMIRQQQRSGYLVDAILGCGRCSETLLVHLRRDPSKHFALKLITKSVLKRMLDEGSEEKAENIRRQLAISRKIYHPNVGNFIDIVDGKKDGCFVVQEYMKGGSLREIPPIISNDTTPNLQHLLIDLLLGLVLLHDNGIAHLCLTPSNIFYAEETACFKVADFGPLFLTVDEILEAELSNTPYYSLPPHLFVEGGLNGFHIDTFCVGLIAASIVPKVHATVWGEFTCATGAARLSVEKVLESARCAVPPLPPHLMSFITDALTTRKEARELLVHPYFDGQFQLNSVPVVLVEVTKDELAHTVQSHPRVRDEPRLLDVLGQDPIQESQMLSSMVETVQATVMSDMDEGSASATVEKSLVFCFCGLNILCGLCQAEILIAFYLCNSCEEFVRCGKCAVNDTHMPGHQLDPYIIHTIEHSKDGPSKATLFHPSSIQDIHALEALEMDANFPVGALTAHLATQRAMERSAARSLAGGSLSKLLSHGTISSNSHVHDAESSVSTPNVKSSHSLKKYSSDSNNLRRSPVVPMEGSAQGMGAAPSFKFNALKEKTKVALPKAEEMDDGTWQQELERCREKKSTELLLFSYGFTELPMEVYSPPPLHVVFLDVSENSLTSLPHELSFLVHLRKLIVSYNKLVDLPDSLGNLSELESFDASHNLLTDLPQTFIYLTNLESIAMDYNDCATVPDSVLDIMGAPVPMDGLSSIQRVGATSSLASSTSLGGLMTHFQTDMANSGDFLRAPRLNVVYLASNDRLTTFPDIERLRRFDSFIIALDNEPSLYKYYMENEIERKLPNVTINWNKIYPDEIIPHLFCGSLRSAQSQMVYRKLRISYVLTVGRGLVPVPPEGGKHKVIVVDDIPGADIFSSFEEAIDFIDESLKKGEGCLVHCFAGLSRSATTVIAYLMVKKGMRLDEAYNVTKKGRPAIFPNKGFFQQLVSLDKELYPGGALLALDSLGRPE